MSTYIAGLLNAEKLRLNKEEKELVESHEEWDEFLLSEEFLVDDKKFYRTLTNFYNKAVPGPRRTDEEEMQRWQARMMPQLQHLQPLQGAPPVPQEAKTEEKYLWQKVIVAVLSLLLVGLAVHQGYVPAETLQWTVAATLMLLFLPRIISLIQEIRQFSEEKEKGEAISQVVDKWAKDVDWLLEEHRNAWLEVRGEPPMTPEAFQECVEVLRLHPVMYDLLEQRRKELIPKFTGITSKILKISQANIQTERHIIISALSALQSPLLAR